MIAYLKGALQSKTSSFVIVDVSGVGYKVFVSAESLRKSGHLESGSAISLYTYLAVRENSMDLYGFVDMEELGFFELLLGVPGIGPKSALAILSLATVETLTQSIGAGDTAYLTKVSGIGKKSADKIILELRDKIGTGEPGTGLREDTDVLEALQSLGYTLKESREALKEIGKEITGTGERVRASLKLLGNEK